MESKNIIEFVVSKINGPITAVEIGVRAGEHAVGILRGLPIDKLYLVDNYLPYTDGPNFRNQAEQDGYYAEMFKRFNNSRDLLDKVVFVTQASEFAVNLFPDNFFDLVYIDACHDYQEVKKDINLWFPKVKKEGYLAGHDYENDWSGVVRAVDEFAAEKGFSLFKLGGTDWLFKKTEELLEEKECECHQWVKLLAQKENETIVTSLLTCLKCGLLKVGARTIRISSTRLDMGNLPVKAIKTGTFNSEIDNGDSGASKTIDWTVGQKQKITLTAACALTFSAPLGPCNLTFQIIQGGTGSYTVTWPAAVKWASATAPTLSTTVGKIDIVSFYWNGTNYFGVGNTNFA